MKRVFFLLFFILQGCATTGPIVYRNEIEKVRKQLEVEALKYKLEKEKKVNEIGYRLVKALPENSRKGKFPYLGARFIKIDRKVKKLFSLIQDNGVVVAFVCKNSPAEIAGLKKGDIVISINSYPINDYYDLSHSLKFLRPHQHVIFKVKRGNEIIDISIDVGEIYLNVKFRMVDMQDVNAAATPNSVLVTYGLLRFIQSDDELAIILGHELAHIARGHIAKRFGTDLLSFLIGITAGYGAESISPGSGDVIMRGVGAAFSAGFSREFEREADYFGILYAYRAGFNIKAGTNVWERFAIEVPKSMIRDFFNTHPTSVERLLRIKKIVAQLEKQKITNNQETRYKQ
jgi:hypothetical protein